MGCGASRPDTDDTPPLGFGPIRRKIDEIKKRRKINGTTLSNKELLEEGLEEDGSPTDSIHNICGKKSLSPESVGSEKDSMDRDPVPEFDEVAKEIEEEKDEERDGFSEMDDEVVFGFGDLPGSPSFREYCLNSVCEIGTSEGEGKKNRKDGREEGEESPSSEEGSSKGKSKKNKGGRFRVLAKGSVAVYSLLNVRGCYKAAPSEGNPRLLCEKAA
ncbi:uncharacterized protein LOC143862227 [Tasmannia lanceolata]|uniref:uncharacterized protein LOC143862227 n=1 Tax=Tasmannia lanceolata TaxID=3420 RepID=UPI00406390E8